MLADRSVQRLGVASRHEQEKLRRVAKGWLLLADRKEW